MKIHSMIVGLVVAATTATLALYAIQEPELEQLQEALPEPVFVGFLVEGSQELSAEVEAYFLDGCLKSDSMTYCACAWDGIRAEYSTSEFNRLGAQIAKTDEIPGELTYIFRRCRKTSRDLM
jgi:hypothetical protein